MPRRDEVHLWRIWLDGPAWAVEPLWEILGAEERALAVRFARRPDYERYVVAHGALRAILGRYLGVPPQRLRFTCGAQGKPALAGIPPPCGLRFNLTHSGQLALCAVAWEREVGVDLEWRRDDLELDAIAALCFSAGEQATLAGLTAERRAAHFFRLWTRKEAFTKALGVGVAGLSRASQPSSGPPVAVRGVVVPAGYAAAVAAFGRGWRPRHFAWQWPPTRFFAQFAPELR